MMCLQVAQYSPHQQTYQSVVASFLCLFFPPFVKFIAMNVDLIQLLVRSLKNHREPTFSS